MEEIVLLHFGAIAVTFMMLLAVWFIDVLVDFMIDIINIG